MCVVCRVVCVVGRKVADFQRSLLGLSRDLSHLQQRTRHFVHFSSVTWPRNFHHCILSESFFTNFTTNFFTVNVPFTFIPIFLFFMHKAPSFFKGFWRVRCEREREIWRKKERTLDFFSFCKFFHFCTTFNASRWRKITRNSSQIRFSGRNFSEKRRKFRITSFFLLAFSLL